MTRISVTIDDFGLTTAVNEAARICLQENCVDSLSILATGAAFKNAVSIASSSPVSVSVHLNCMEPPFLSGAEFPESYTAWMRKSDELAEQVREEWRMQIESILTSGMMVTMLDSHRHVHHLPGLREVALDLALEYGIGTIRTAILPDRWKRPSGLILHKHGKTLAEMAAVRGIGTPDAILGFSCSGGVTRKYLEDMSDKIEDMGLVELVMHPATIPVWKSTQPEELALMRSDWFREWTGRS